MKISIVTISFDQGRFLREAMESILGQQEVDLEYIVVDAGSADGSRELIMAYERRLGGMLLENDRGPADGLNKGFSLASGEVFGYVNADDFLLPGALARVRDAFESDKALDVVQGHGIVVDGAGKWLCNIYSNRFSAYRFAIGVSRVVQPSTFFRAQAFHRSGGFNILNRTCWDGELLANMALGGARFRVVDAMLAGFRLHDQSISGTGRLRSTYLADLNRIQKKILGRSPNVWDYVAQGMLRGVDSVTHPGITLQAAVRRFGGDRWFRSQRSESVERSGQ